MQQVRRLAEWSQSPRVDRDTGEVQNALFALSTPLLELVERIWRLSADLVEVRCLGRGQGPVTNAFTRPGRNIAEPFWQVAKDEFTEATTPATLMPHTLCVTSAPIIIVACHHREPTGGVKSFLHHIMASERLASGLVSSRWGLKSATLKAGWPVGEWGTLGATLSMRLLSLLLASCGMD